MTRNLRFLISNFLATFGLLSIATAQNEVEVQRHIIIPGQTKPIPVSVSGFSGEVAQVLQFDLYVQGFSFTNSEAAQYLITGSNNGNVQGRATDNLNKSTLVSKSYTGASPRREAHAFVDDFVQALGRKGIGRTKIAFKGDTGSSSEIYLADFDGHNAQAVTKTTPSLPHPVGCRAGRRSTTP